MSPVGFTNGTSGGTRLIFKDSTFRNVVFRNTLFLTNENLNQLSGPSGKGTINENLNFDGYTCPDISEKMFFPS